MDINFVVSDPDRVALVMEPRSMDGLHAIDIKKTGEYEICLDNSFSSFTGKQELCLWQITTFIVFYMHLKYKLCHVRIH